MKVLVTGATGLLGHHIVFQLVKSGYTVVCFVRKTSNISYLKELGVDFYFGDLLNSLDLYESTKSVDIVINAAAETSPHFNRVRDYEQLNIDAPKILYRCAEIHKVSRFIHVSSAAVFGQEHHENPATEQSSISEPFKRIAYVKSKQIIQNWLLSQSPQSSIKLVIVNPSFMIGPYDLKPSSGALLEMVIRNKLVVIPPGGKSFIHVGDVAKAIIASIRYGKHQECYLLTNHNLKFNEALPGIAQQLGLRRRFFHIPKPLLLLAGFIGSCLSQLGINNRLTYYNVKSLCLDNFYDSTKAQIELKLTFSDLEKAVDEYVLWREYDENLTRKAS